MHRHGPTDKEPSGFRLGVLTHHRAFLHRLRRKLKKRKKPIGLWVSRWTLTG